MIASGDEAPSRCLIRPALRASPRVEARTPQSLIVIGGGTVINNRAAIVSEGAEIRIGRRCLIGGEFQAFDTNAHQLALAERHLPDQAPRAVVVEDDVFIGSRVTLLKGCRIGRGARRKRGKREGRRRRRIERDPRQLLRQG